jgi:hypothetical protein
LFPTKKPTLKKIILCLACLSANASAFAAGLTCYEDPRTNAHQCFDPKQVQEKGGIRVTSLYTGGPNGVSKTNFTINTNCGTGVTHLKDRLGVSFAGGDGNETKAIRSLRTWMCEAELQGKKGKK